MEFYRKSVYDMHCSAFSYYAKTDRFVANLATSIVSRGKKQLTMTELKQVSPEFLWLLRDVILEPTNPSGKPCHIRDFLIETVHRTLLLLIWFLNILAVYVCMQFYIMHSLHELCMNNVYIGVCVHVCVYIHVHVHG